MQENSRALVLVLWKGARESFKVLTRVANSVDVWWEQDPGEEESRQELENPSIHLNSGSWASSSHRDPLGTFDARHTK